MSDVEHKTIPQRLRAALSSGPQKTLKELSAELSLPEKDLVPALDKLRRSLERDRHLLQVAPARCIACGFAFETRDRLSKPSRCPACRSERIEPPRFSVRERG